MEFIEWIHYIPTIKMGWATIALSMSIRDAKSWKEEIDLGNRIGLIESPCLN